MVAGFVVAADTYLRASTFHDLREEKKKKKKKKKERADLSHAISRSEKYLSLSLSVN